MNSIPHPILGIVSGTLAAGVFSWVPSLHSKLIKSILEEPSFPVEVLASFLIYKLIGNVLTGLRVGMVSYSIALATYDAKSRAILNTYFMPHEYFTKNSFHDTIELINNDIETVEESSMSVINYTARVSTQLAITTYILMNKSVELTLVCFMCCVGHIGIQQWFANAFYIPSIRPIQEGKERQNELIRDCFEKHEMYRVYHKEESVFNRWMDHQVNIMKHRMNESYTFGSMVCINLTTGSLMLALLMLYGRNDRELIHEFSMYMFSIFQILEQSVDLIKDFKGKYSKRERVGKFFENSSKRDEWGFLINAEPTIHIKDLSFGYTHDRNIISQFNMKIPYGARVGFHGMSGAGKSTLLKLMMGLYRPREGEIKWNDLDLMEHDREWFYTKGISYVPQDPVLFKDEPIVDHVITNDIPRSGPMSGGQRQRAVLAYAMSREPLVLFLDEPTCHQDKENTDKVVDSLKKFRGTIIVISHDRDFLKRFCNITRKVN